CEISPLLKKSLMILPKQLLRFLITHFLIISRLRLLAVLRSLRRHIRITTVKIMVPLCLVLLVNLVRMGDVQISN
ncbi:MAG: hypothetical protein K8R67_12175, partial [Desulfobacteraceae bacterium]|nr:hypothetical protein [Desulfobacteraceae bacterium]